MPTTELLAQLLVRDDTLSELAALKQDAKDFGWRRMVREREKRATLEPLYRAAKALLPKLEVSQQNLNHYASLANFYTIYDLRRMTAEQANLYLLCYAWQRYRQLTDNLVDALGYHMKQLEDQTKAQADQQYFDEQVKRQKETPKVGRLLLLYVDASVPDSSSVSHRGRRVPAHVRRHAVDCLPAQAELADRLRAQALARGLQVLLGHDLVGAAAHVAERRGVGHRVAIGNCASA